MGSMPGISIANKACKGYKSSKTTEIYTHLSTAILQKIKSPFDYINLFCIFEEILYDAFHTYTAKMMGNSMILSYL